MEKSKLKQYRVSIEVEKQRGTCTAGHKVGDKWIVDETTPAGMCIGAFYVCILGFRVLRYGGSWPWEKESDEYKCACPDAENPVIFRLRRLYD